MKFLLTFKESIRNKYSEVGVDNYYQNNKDIYENPHQKRVEKCLDWIISEIDIDRFLDLSCGNGDLSLYLKSKDLNNFEGCDPYFSEIYQNNTGKKCYDFSFQDIANGKLSNKKYDTVICSYALHLCPKSYLNTLLYQLSLICDKFILISQSKYPIINDDYFDLIESTIIERTHCKIFKSKLN